MLHQALQGTIAQDYIQPDCFLAKKPGCPLTYSIQDERMILRNLGLFPKLTFNECREETGLKMSNSIIKRVT